MNPRGKSQTSQGRRVGSPAFALPSALTKQGTALMNQQCWCWGKDVQRIEGNALLMYGFTRQRPPDGHKGASMYTLRLPYGRSLVLWGFGLWYGDAALGGMYVNRFTFVPQWTIVRELNGVIWSAEQLPLAPMGKEEWDHCAHWLLPGALHCISVYEQWLLSTLGLDYRQECVRSFSKPAASAESMAEAWESLACRLIEGEEYRKC